MTHIRPIGTCRRKPMTEALWNKDSGPNCFNALLIIGFKAFTLRRWAQLQMKISTHDRSPSKVETLVISHNAINQDWISASSRQVHSAIQDACDSSWKLQIIQRVWCLHSRCLSHSQLVRSSQCKDMWNKHLIVWTITADFILSNPKIWSPAF